MSEGVDLDKFVASFPALVEAEGGLPRIKRLVIALGVYGHLSPRVAEPDDSMAELSDSSLAARRLPPGWHWRRLDEVADYNTGSRVEPTAIEPTAWLLELEDIEKDSSRLIARTTAGERSPKSTKSRFGKGDILYGKLRPYLDKVLVADADGYCTTELAPVRPGPLMTSEFLRYVMKSPDFITYASSKTYGMNLPRLATRDAEAWSVPVPPLVEQQRIVAKVDELMRLIDDLEAKQARKREVQARLRTSALDALTKAEGPEELATAWKRVEDNFEVLFERAEGVAGLRTLIRDLAVCGRIVRRRVEDGTGEDLRVAIRDDLATMGVGWEPPDDAAIAADSGSVLPRWWAWARLRNLATFGPRNGYSPKSVDYPTQVKSLTLTATTSGRFLAEHSKYIDERIDADSHLWLEDGDVLIQRSNSIEYVGAAAVFRGPSRTFIYPDLMMKVRVASKVDVRFVHLCLCSTATRTYLRARATGTAGSMPKINQAVVAGTPIPLPALEEQKRIVAKVEALMKLCDDLEAKLKAKEATAKRLVEAVVAEMVA